MAPRESQNRASLKWEKENMSVGGCKVNKVQASAFKAYCETQGSTSNTVLKDFVLGCIGEQEPGTATGRPAGAEGISLHQKAIRTAQEAAQSVGETVPQFVERAVETQAKRDRSSMALGINPVTGEKLDRKG